MRNRVLILWMTLGLIFSRLGVGGAQAAVAIPFGGHAFAYSPSVILPNNQTRAQMDSTVGTFYSAWKTAYVIGGCASGRRRINYNGTQQTVSEAHGYGMLAAVLMAGYDPDAQTMFDDFYRYFRAHNATGAGGANLMAWQQDAACANINGADSASDGDLDIGMALLMADRQWGSCGSIDYRSEGLKVVAAIKAGELDTTYAYVKLGNWVGTGDATFYPSTRSSDFLLSHYRSFKWASGDATWDTVLNTTYSIIGSLQSNYSPGTGLLPDFIKNPLSSPAPVVGFFLESAATDGNWGYNACRDPWRITTDLVVSGDVRAKAAMQKIKTFIKFNSGGNASNLNAERNLNGSVIGNYEDLSFSAPYMVCAMSDPSDQAWLNLLWTRISSSPAQDYFGDTIKLLSMIVTTGNWWQPEAFGDPCAVGTATYTVTPAVTATFSRTPSSSRTSSPGPTPLNTATQSSSATSTQSFTQTFNATPSLSFTKVETLTATVPLASATASPSPSASATPVGANCHNLLAYYTSWSKPAYSAANIPYSKLTHICHAFLLPQADGSLPVPTDFVELSLVPQAHANNVKVLVSVGGASGSANFSAIASSVAIRANFVAQVKAFILANNYDGVDFDWEFPESATDRTNFTGLIQAMRSGFNSAPNAHPEWLITGAYSWTSYYGQFYDFAALVPLVDFFNVMTYDAHGSWSSHSGHNAPLGPAAGDPDSASMQTAINYFVNTRGVPLNKINFGLAFYGYNFPTATLHANCPTCATDVQSLTYAQLQAYVGNGWQRVWDLSASSPYLKDNANTRIISYDDPQSILAKTDFALNSRGLAGVFMWDLSQDNLGGGNQPLLDAMRAGFNCGPTYTPSSTPTPITFNVPGRIQAEDYSAALDSDPGNNGGAYRTGDVDIEVTSDIGGGYDVGWTVAGEWLDYKINVLSSGTYDIALRVAAASGTGMGVQLSVDGVPLAGPINIPSTGGWQTWVDVNAPAQNFTVGIHSLRMVINKGGFNLNYIDIKTPPTPTPTSTVTQTSVPPGSTVTHTPSPTPAPPTATSSPTPGDGPLVILACVAGPNPNPSRFSIHLDGSADEAELRIYDRAMRCVADLKQGALNRGWNQIPLPIDFSRAGNGTYFFRVQCKRQGHDASRPAMGRLVVLR